jgi:hypothetical protein
VNLTDRLGNQTVKFDLPMDSLPPPTPENQATFLYRGTTLTHEEARNLMEHLDDDPTDIVVDFLKEVQAAAEAATGLEYPAVSCSICLHQNPFLCLVWPMNGVPHETFLAATKAELLEKLAAWKAGKEGSPS